MELSCTTGAYGRLKASGRLFMVVGTTSTTSTIRFKFETRCYEFMDSTLRDTAVGASAKDWEDASKL